MQLLVAVQVYQFPISVRVGATLRASVLMMPMQFFAIDEVHAAHAADPVLLFG
jgi:hypothetical protein